MVADLSQARDLLRTARFGRSLVVLPVVDSTMDACHRAAAHAPNGHVIVADQQRNGRGSHGRAWSSPAGSGLYFSALDRPRISTADLAPLTLAVGLAVAHAIDEARMNPAEHDPAQHERAQIKWPNDIWLHKKKCAGILVETKTTGGASAGHEATVIIGVGINVTSQFDGELASSATSIQPSGGAPPIDRGQLLATTLGHIETWVDRYIREGSEPMIRTLTPRLALIQEPVRCGDASGTLVGLSSSGALRLQTDGGMREIVSGRLLRQ